MPRTLRRPTIALLLWVMMVAMMLEATSSKQSSSLAATIHRKTTPFLKGETTAFLSSKKGVLVAQEEDEEQDISNEIVTTRGGAAADATTTSSSWDGLKHRLRIGGYFATWYALNVVYNIVNKKVLNEVPAPLTVGAIQFGVGGLYCLALWLTRLRAIPQISSRAVWISLFGIGLCHCGGQLAMLISLGAGPVSFTHIVKALEPFFSAMVAALVFGKWMNPVVYATLIPVVGGVGYACLKEPSFSWLSFYGAMASNVFFALRAVYSKVAMSKKEEEAPSTTTKGNKKQATAVSAPPPQAPISSVNLFGLVTWMAFFVSWIPAIIQEGRGFLDGWTATITEGRRTAPELFNMIVMSGLFHYLNNEVMYMALSQVHPVTLAVGNTMKRVFIMVASVLVFRNPVSLQAAIGAAIGISGVLLYSLTKQHYEKIEAAAAADSKGKTSKKK